MIKYAHIPSETLLVSLKPGDRIIQTTSGNYKVRKNGRTFIKIDDEIVRVTPLLTRNQNHEAERKV